VVRIPLPSLAAEPPVRYVDFVATNLDPLRREALEVLGDDDEADRLYPQVLTDVAVRWGWLWRPDAAQRYLKRSFQRRSQRVQTRWAPEESTQIEFVVWGAERPRPRAAYSTGATRLAPYLRPTVRTEFGPVAEAAVAWWHAYEIHRRNRWITLGVLVFSLLALLFQAPTG